MIASLLSWIRRSSRRAVALALGAGLLALAVDAFIGHFAGTQGDHPARLLPVGYGALAALVLAVIAPLRATAPFAVASRLLGGAGFGLGVLGTALHLGALWRELEGRLTLASLEGALSVAPPVLAPLGFAALGGVLLFLPSRRLLLRIRVGRAPRAPGQLVPLPAPARLDRADQG